MEMVTFAFHSSKCQECRDRLLIQQLCQNKRFLYNDQIAPNPFSLGDIFSPSICSLLYLKLRLQFSSYIPFSRVLVGYPECKRIFFSLCVKLKDKHLWMCLPAGVKPGCVPSYYFKSDSNYQRSKSQKTFPPWSES